MDEINLGDRPLSVDNSPKTISGFVIAAALLLVASLLFLGLFLLIPSFVCSLIAFFQYRKQPGRKGKILMYIVLVASFLLSLRILILI